MYYFRFELTLEPTGETGVFMVRRDCVAKWFEKYINVLETNAHLTTRGKVELSNEYREMFKV